MPKIYQAHEQRISLVTIVMNRVFRDDTLREIDISYIDQLPVLVQPIFVTLTKIGCTALTSLFLNNAA